eukprot:2524727-Pleurochrysis_carterae.AAC.1
MLMSGPPELPELIAASVCRFGIQNQSEREPKIGFGSPDCSIKRGKTGSLRRFMCDVALPFIGAYCQTVLRIAAPVGPTANACMYPCQQLCASGAKVGPRRTSRN